MQVTHGSAVTSLQGFELISTEPTTKTIIPTSFSLVQCHVPRPHQMVIEPSGLFIKRREFGHGSLETWMRAQAYFHIAALIDHTYSIIIPSFEKGLLFYLSVHSLSLSIS